MAVPPVPIPSPGPSPAPSPGPGCWPASVHCHVGQRLGVFALCAPFWVPGGQDRGADRGQLADLLGGEHVEKRATDLLNMAGGSRTERPGAVRRELCDLAATDGRAVLPADAPAFLQ